MSGPVPSACPKLHLFDAKVLDRVASQQPVQPVTSIQPVAASFPVPCSETSNSWLVTHAGHRSQLSQLPDVQRRKAATAMLMRLMEVMGMDEEEEEEEEEEGDQHAGSREE